MILFLFASTLKFTFVKFKGLVNSNQLRCWCAFFLLNYFGFKLCVIFYTFSFHLWFFIIFVSSLHLGSFLLQWKLKNQQRKTLVAVKLEGVEDEIPASVVIVNPSDKTAVADIEVVSFLIAEIGLSDDRLVYFPGLKFIFDDNPGLVWKISIQGIPVLLTHSGISIFTFSPRC